MGIERLTKAAAAAGYAMANSEELLIPAPAPKKVEPQGWRSAEPVQHKPEQRALVPFRPTHSFRHWWFALSSRATA